MSVSSFEFAWHLIKFKIENNMRWAVEICLFLVFIVNW